MRGMHRQTGKFIEGLEHLVQSIRIILSTPLGSRVMLPEFGSEVYKLIDQPMTTSNELKLYTACIEALRRWETRIEVQQVQLVKPTVEGVLELSIVGLYEGSLVELTTEIGRGRTQVPIRVIRPATPTTPTVPEIPVDPSTPTTPSGDARWTTFLFGDETFIFGDDSYGWDE